MALASFEKQVWESWIVSADFSDDLVTGETIVLATSTVTATDKTGTLDATVLDQSGKAVSGSLLQIRVQAGTEALSMYKITFKAITSMSNQYELDINMKVKDQ